MFEQLTDLPPDARAADERPVPDDLYRWVVFGVRQRRFRDGRDTTPFAPPGASLDVLDGVPRVESVLGIVLLPRDMTQPESAQYLLRHRGFIRRLCAQHDELDGDECIDKFVSYLENNDYDVPEPDETSFDPPQNGGA
jgi:hypothetical protein